MEIGQEMVNLGEDMCKILDDYFFGVFTKEDKHIVPVSEQIFRGEENEKLKDVEITRELVVKEIDEIKKFKLPGPDKVYPRVLK